MTDPADLTGGELLEAVVKATIGWNRARFTDFSWSGVGKVIEYLADEGYEVEVSVSGCNEDLDDWVRYACIVWQVPNDDNMVKATSDDSMARAVFEAALMAIGVGDNA